MNKVKCCNNCKYCHMVRSKPMFCIIHGFDVNVDEKCDQYIPEDPMVTYEA